MKWTQEEIEFLLELLDLPTKEIYLFFCESFGRSHRTYDSVQKKIKVLKTTYGDTESPILADEVEQVSFLENQPTLNIQKYINSDVEDWVNSLQNLSLQYKKTEITKKKYTNQKEDKTSLCVVYSDTHFGKKTKWFNMEEAHKRMVSVPFKIKESSLPEIDEIVIMLIGDIVEGENIYLTQNNHIECPVIDQVQGAVKALWETILTFRELYNVPVRIETSPGNHGRVSKMAHEKSNWDNIVYYTLSVISEKYNDPNIIINCNYDAFKTFKVKDKNIMINHHGVKHASTPATREKIAGWIASKEFDMLCFTAGTKVLNELGVPFNIEEVKEGDILFGKNGSTVVEKVHPVREVNEEIYELNVEGVPPSLITGVTGEHPFYTLQNLTCHLPSREKRSCHPEKSMESGPCSRCDPKFDLNPAWIETKNLSKGDFIGVSTPKIPKDAINEPRLAKLLGYFLAEGCYMKQIDPRTKNKIYRGVSFVFHEKEVFYHNEVKLFFKEFFNDHMYSYTYPGSKGYTLSKSNLEAVEFFLDNAGEYSFDKQISEWSWSLDKESRLALLSGWLFGDAHVQSELTKNRLKNRIIGSTTSEKLASQMFLIAISCGLKPTYNIKKERNGDHIEHTICFYGESCKLIFEYNNLSYIESSKKKETSFFFEGQYYRKILNIKSKKEKTLVYNIRTSTSEYIAGLLSSHNCHGHWHEWHVGNWLGRFVIGNGCMCGPDDLSEQMGKEDAARQAYFLITPNKPIWGFSFTEWETKTIES